MQIFQLCIYTQCHFGPVVRSSGEQPRGLVFTALLSGGCAGPGAGGVRGGSSHRGRAALPGSGLRENLSSPWAWSAAWLRPKTLYMSTEHADGLSSVVIIMQ